MVQVMVYDPSGALATSPIDTWKNLKYNFGAKPKPYYEGRNVLAFNGVSIGKGHLAEAKAAINSPRAAMNGAQSVFSRKEEPHDHAEGGGGYGTGDTDAAGWSCWRRLRRKKDA